MRGKIYSSWTVSEARSGAKVFLTLNQILKISILLFLKNFISLVIFSLEIENSFTGCFKACEQDIKNFHQHLNFYVSKLK